jgi:hypothetical protein
MLLLLILLQNINTLVVRKLTNLTSCDQVHILNFPWESTLWNNNKKKQTKVSSSFMPLRMLNETLLYVWRCVLLGRLVLIGNLRFKSCLTGDDRNLPATVRLLYLFFFSPYFTCYGSKGVIKNQDIYI